MFSLICFAVRFSFAFLHSEDKDTEVFCIVFFVAGEEYLGEVVDADEGVGFGIVETVEIFFCVFEITLLTYFCFVYVFEFLTIIDTSIDNNQINKFSVLIKIICFLLVCLTVSHKQKRNHTCLL